MEETAYLALAEAEDHGWYYRARREAVDRLMKRFAPRLPRPLRILDIGSGTGGSTSMLRRYGDVLGMEPSPLARELSRKRFPDLKVEPWTIDDLPKEATQDFDVAVILCVLYHQNIKDPAAALKNIAAVQKPGSILIWNEPAYPFLWRQHDRQTAAGRRFYPRSMHQLLKDQGYELVFQSHLLAWAFPIACLLALKDRWQWGSDRQTTSAAEGTDHKPVPGLVNRLLRWITFSEWRLSRLGLGLPFGVSHLLVARRL
jgi:SAM-dependent methyltransferase